MREFALRNTSFALVLALALLEAGCGDEGPPAPEPGTITVSVVSPAGAEGAALIEVAEPVTQVSAPGGQAFARTEGASTRVAVIRDVAGVLSMILEVPDIHRPPEMLLVQVAGPDDRLRADLTGYRLEVER
jgi:hypothetical protein